VKTSILHHFKRKDLTHINSCVSNNGTVYICAQTQSPLSLDSSSNGNPVFRNSISGLDNVFSLPEQIRYDKGGKSQTQYVFQIILRYFNFM